MTSDEDYKETPKHQTPNIFVGDLVKVRGEDWIGGKLGVVTEVRELVFEQTNQTYIMITAQVEDQDFTFGPKDFELVSRAEERE